MSSASNIAITPTDLMIRKSSRTCAPATTVLVKRKGKGGVLLSKIHSLFVRSNNKNKNETKLLFRPPSRLDSTSRIKLTDIDEQDQVPCSSSSSSSSTTSEDTPPSPASGDDLSDVSDDSVNTSERPRQAMSQKESDKSSSNGNSKDLDDPALASDDCFYPSTPDTLDSESTDSSFNSEMYVYDDPLVAAGEFFLPSLPDDDDSTDDDVYVYDDPVIASDGRLFPSFPLSSVKESESIVSASSATNSRGATDSNVAAVSDATTYSTDSLWDSKCVAVDEMKWSQNPAPENPGFYTGPAKFGTIPHGLGRLSFVNGDTYHGPFRNGLKHGPNGVYVTQNGSTYRGNYVNNKRHGHGQHMIATVVRYEGYFEAGLPNGFGRAYYDNGSLQYEGIWENGLPVNKVMLPFQGEEDSVISSGQLARDDDASTTTSRSRMYSMYDPDKVPQGDDWTVESGFSDLTSIGGGSRWSINESTRSIDDDDDDESLSGGGGNEVSMYAPPSLTRIDSRRPARGLPRRKNGSVGDLKPSSLYAAQ